MTQPYLLLVPGVARPEKNHVSWESRHLRREARCLCMYHEIITFKQPTYLYNVILERRPSSRSRGINATNIRSFHHRTESFALSFFPSTTEKWNSLDTSTRSLILKSSFKNEVLKRIRPKRKEIFGINDRDGQKWITQLRVRLSPLMLINFTITLTTPLFQCATSMTVLMTPAISYCTAGNSPSFV